MKAKFLLLVVSFLEGASLLAFELLGAKMLSPYFGTSYHVWSITLFVTLLGIALGYYIAHKLITRGRDIHKIIRYIFTANTLILSVLPFFSDGLLKHTVELNFTVGMFISVIVLFLPSFVLFGLVSPLLISLVSAAENNGSKIPSLIFSISTFGGVFGVYFFGFYTIPHKGIIYSFFLIDAFNLVSTLLILYYSLRFRSLNSK